jgi:hypothetical protein
MSEKEQNQHGKKKGFLGKIMEALDKKMEEKAKKSPCCGGSDHPNKEKGSSCC